jgi:hypothetical protein
LNSRGRRRVAQVTRVTAKQIEAGGSRFRKHGGDEIGSSSRYSRSSVRLACAGEIEQLRREAEERAAEYAASAAKDREAKRGRTAGLLLAAHEALRAKTAAEVDPLSRDEDRFTVTLGVAVHEAIYALDAAEKGVRSAAESLRRQAEELDRAVERDGGYVASFYSQAMFEARGEEEKRAAAVENGRQIVKLVAAHLGVEFKELVAPMAAPAEQSDIIAEGEDGAVIHDTLGEEGGAS